MGCPRHLSPLACARFFDDIARIEKASRSSSALRMDEEWMITETVCRVLGLSSVENVGDDPSSVAVLRRVDVRSL